MKNDPNHSDGLQPSLSKWFLLALGIGCVIGAGIFVMIGEATGSRAGPAVILSFILTSITCACAAFCYAELATIYPDSGSAYSYAYKIFGRFTGILVSTLLILEYGIAASAVAVGWSEYFYNILMDYNLQPSLLWAKATGTVITDYTGQQHKAFFNVPAFISMVVVMLILIKGVQETAFINMIMVLLKIAVIVLFIIIGISYIEPSNYSPFIPAYEPNTGSYGIYGIFSASTLIFFAYMGFDTVSTAGSEAKNPQRDIPFGIIGTLIVCTILYVLLAIVLCGVVNYQDLRGSAAPLVLASQKIGIVWFDQVLKFGALIALSSVMLVSSYGLIRVTTIMAQDGLLPSIFAKISPKTKTPIMNTLIFGSIMALTAGFLPIDLLGDIVSSGTLFAFVIVCAGVLVLDYTKPEIERAFKCPLKPMIPIIGILTCLFMALSSGITTILLLIAYSIISVGGIYGYIWWKSRK